MEPWLFIPLPLTFCCSHDLGNHDVLTGTFADMAVSLKFEVFTFLHTLSWQVRQSLIAQA